MELIWTNVFPLESVGIGHLFRVFPVNLVPHTTTGVLDSRFLSVSTLAKKNEVETALNHCLVNQLTEQYLPRLLTTW
jgi:hypothetical protein